MRRALHKIPPLFLCSLLSVVAHLAFVLSLALLGEYRFGAAVGAAPAVMVELAAASSAAPPERREAPAARRPAVKAPAPSTVRTPAPAPQLQSPGAAPRVASAPPRQQANPAAEPAQPEPVPAQPGPEAPPEQAEPEPSRAASGPQPAVAASAQPEREPRAGSARPVPAAQQQMAAPQGSSRLQAVGEFLSASQEKLTYLITMHGLPVGDAQLESRQDQGVTTISLRVKSNAALSGLFPIDNEIETRHIDGRFIMTRIRQQEGSFRSDESFTINLGKRRVTWYGISTPRTLTLTVPSDQVLDTLSGIYYLRKRDLKVGATETLHIYDSESYAEVPVQILRREQLRLPNLTWVDTLVLRPREGSGFFRGNGDLLIWMTDDERRVPVKITTSMSLGRVSAELVSAESQPHAEAKRDL